MDFYDSCISGYRVGVAVRSEDGLAFVSESISAASILTLSGSLNVASDWIELAVSSITKLIYISDSSKNCS